MQPINIIIHIVSSHLSYGKTILSLENGQTWWQGQKLIDFILQCTWKTRFLGISSQGLSRAPSDRISHSIHIVRTSCRQFPARSGNFCLLVEVVYWPYDLKSVYPTINLAFLGIIVKLKFVGYHLAFQHNDLFHLPYMAVAEISLGISLQVRPEEPFLLLKYIITLSLILCSYYWQSLSCKYSFL